MPEAELFVEGERKLGLYTVRIARYRTTGWSPTIPPLEMMVTNRRLFLRPEVRKKYPPASIPRSYIKSVREVDLDAMHGLAISLTTGHNIYIYIDKENADRIVEDIEAMKLPPPNFQFDAKIVESDIQRIIDFINRM